MNTLNTVIKACKSIQTKYEKSKGKDSIEANFYRILIKCLLLEHKYPAKVKAANKPIYHYFQYQLPEYSTGYFEFLYNPYNPVRFALETFSSIEYIQTEY